MDAFDTLYRNVVQLRQDLPELVAKAAEDNEAELVDLNVSQMDKGIGGDGKNIKPNYSPNYAKFKGFKTPNLKVTGDYHSSITMERKGSRLLWGSSDEGSDKVDFLERHYNNSQYGIAPQNAQEAADIIEPDLITLVGNEITKGL